METEAKRKNRSRNKPKKTTGVVRESPQDVGFCEPLDRYVELPSGILGQFYNLHNGNRPTSSAYLERLTNLTHESEEYTDTRRLLSRPSYQKSYGINHQAIYRKTIGGTILLRRFGARDDHTILWSNNTHMMAFEKKVADPEPTAHDKELSIVAASIELEARRDAGFITHIDILQNASDEAQTAESPLSLPIYDLEHTFPDGKKHTLAKTHMKTDFLFGLPFGTGAKFYTVEYDRHSEDMEPSKSLKRVSWLKKILMLSAASIGEHPLYERYFNVPNLQMLAIFQGYVREAHFRRLALKYARYPNQFLSAVVPPFNPIAMPYIMPELYNGKLDERTGEYVPVWRRPNGTLYSLKDGKEVK